MAKYGKWIGGFIGLIAGGPLGALAGFALGSLLDGDGDDVQKINKNSYGHRSSAYSNTQSQANYQSRTRYEEEQRNTFRFSLLVLASYIIRADGKVMHSEMNLLRQWLRNNFGQNAVDDGEQIILKLFEQQKLLGHSEFRSMVMGSCEQLRQIMSYEQRLQLLNFLVMIAQADGFVATAEVNALRECTLALGLSETDLNSMLNLQDAGTNLDAAYKVLGVSPTATNDEVKAAFRRLTLQNHPDKVASLGEDVRKAAEKKFKEINAAKETIWKARKL
ncbi:MAG: TerB family tellurite resistance protein [Prevotella sp.]|nr:TerB family tellurite resistance protein [Prevotella sp.]